MIFVQKPTAVDVCAANAVVPKCVLVFPRNSHSGFRKLRVYNWLQGRNKAEPPNTNQMRDKRKNDTTGVSATMAQEVATAATEKPEL